MLRAIALAFDTTYAVLWICQRLQCGELAEIRVAKDRQGNSKNFAYVEFKSSVRVISIAV